MNGLVGKQEKIFAFLKEYMLANQYPPSIREIKDKLNLSSTSVVDYNLKGLEEKGYIERGNSTARSIRILYFEESNEQEKNGSLSYAAVNSRGTIDRYAFPLVGTIAAGEPIPFLEDTHPLNTYEESIEVAVDLVTRGKALTPAELEKFFALRVKGWSMIDALIADGDIVILRQQDTAEVGETIAAWIKDRHETTLKKYYPELEKGQIRLQPANQSMEPIMVEAKNMEIKGKLVAVLRSC